MDSRSPGEHTTRVRLRVGQYLTVVSYLGNSLCWETIIRYHRIQAFRTREPWYRLDDSRLQLVPVQISQATIHSTVQNEVGGCDTNA